MGEHRVPEQRVGDGGEPSGTVAGVGGGRTPGIGEGGPVAIGVVRPRQTLPAAGAGGQLPAPVEGECVVRASVGNFTDLQSPGFGITSRENADG